MPQGWVTAQLAKGRDGEGMSEEVHRLCKMAASLVHTVPVADLRNHLPCSPPAAGEQGFSQQGKISQMMSSLRDQDDPPGGSYTFQHYCGQPVIKTSIKPLPEEVLIPKSLHTRPLLQRDARLSLALPLLKWHH